MTRTRRASQFDYEIVYVFEGLEGEFLLILGVSITVAEYDSLDFGGVNTKKAHLASASL